MKKNLFLIGIALILATIYVVFFTGWFQPKVIHISHTSRGQSRRQLIFGLGNDYELTEVKAVRLDEWQTNRNVEPLWHLISDEGSDDIDHFFYGENISGMDPAIEGARPKSLQPGVKYLLFITAGKAKGRHEFEIGNPSNISTNK